MQQTYQELLKRARDNLPESVYESARFEIPKVKGHIQGNKTVISNFLQIASTLRRPVDHLLKYILRALATPGEIKKNLLVFGRKLSANIINEKIRLYAREFVICSECGKPDTQIIKEGELSYLRCMACGAKNRVKSKI